MALSVLSTDATMASLCCPLLGRMFSPPRLKLSADLCLFSCRTTSLSYLCVPGGVVSSCSDPRLTPNPPPGTSPP